MRLIRVLLAGCLVACLPGEAGAADGLERVEGYLAERMRSNDVPGLSYAVVRGDRIVRSGGLGVDGAGRAMTSRTPGGFGSISKTVTAAAVLRLVDRGRLELDEPVRPRLPWFRLADAGATGRITVRHVLDQTSGISARDGYARSDRGDNEPGAIRRWVQGLATVRPTAEPGARHQYSPANAMIAAALVEEVTGQAFAEYLRAEVLTPLGMADTIVDAAGAERMPPGHEYFFGRIRRAASSYDGSGIPYGYLAGSATDLAKLAMIQTSRRFLSKDVTTPPARGSYGLGWRFSELDATGDRIVWHAGAATGYHAIVVAAPESGWAVVVQQNAWSALKDGSLNAAGFGALALVLGGEPEPPPAESTALPLAGLGAVALALAAGIVLVLRQLLRRTGPNPAGPAARSGGRWRPGAAAGAAGAAAVAGLGVAVAAGWWLPRAFDLRLGQVVRFLPDVGGLAVVVVALGLVLAACAVALAVRIALGGAAPANDSQLAGRAE